MKWMSRYGSRKFLTWVTGTAALWCGKIDGWQWLALTVLWAFGNSIDKVIALKRAGGEIEKDRESQSIPD